MLKTLSAGALVVSFGSCAFLGCSSSTAGGGSSSAGSGASAGLAASGGAPGSAGSGASAGLNGSAGSGATAGAAAGSGGGAGLEPSGGAGGGSGSGGSGGSGGAAGAGGSAGAGGTVSCATAGYTLCDDFEGAAPGDAASAWTIIKNGYTVETVTTQAHSGTHSVHVMATANGGYGYISETKTFPATDFWGRAYMRIVAPSSGHEVFAGLDTNLMEPQGEQVRMLNNTGGGNIVTNRRSDDMSKGSATKIPMSTWFCYEWHETPTKLSIYLNGKELTDVDEAWTEPTFVAFVLGFERFGGGTAGDIWIDDVAVNSAQVGCN
jgi:hypothetical protein